MPKFTGLEPQVPHSNYHIKWGTPFIFEETHIPFVGLSKLFRKQ